MSLADDCEFLDSLKKQIAKQQSSQKARKKSATHPNNRATTIDHIKKLNKVLTTNKTFHLSYDHHGVFKYLKYVSRPPCCFTLIGSVKLFVWYFQFYGNFNVLFALCENPSPSSLNAGQLVTALEQRKNRGASNGQSAKLKKKLDDQYEKYSVFTGLDLSKGIPYLKS